MSNYRESAAPDRSLLVVGFAERLFAVDRTSGEIRWEVAIGEMAGEGHQTIELSITDGVVIAANSRELWFVEYKTGRVYAQVKLEHKFTRPVMVVDEGMLFVTGDGAVSCFTTRGHKVWTQPFEEKKNWGKVAAVSLGLPGNVRQADHS